MKIEGYRETFYIFSKQASDIVRQLALAGIGVVWILKPTPAPTATIPVQLPVDLLWPSLGLLIALAIDLLHYVVGSIIWRLEYRKLEALNLPDLENREFYHEQWKESVVTGLLWIKVAVAVVAWAALLLAVSRRLV